VARWLDNIGIPRRTLGESQRLNLPLATEQLAQLYQKQKFSAKEIAGLARCSQQTILRRLKHQGIRIRDHKELAELATKYPRQPFNGDLRDKMYYRGYFTGDLTLERTSKYTLTIGLSTTCNASIQLFRDLFERYGGFATCSHRDPLKGSYEWRVRTYLARPSFDYLIHKAIRLPDEARGERFYHFLAGYVDAEGSLYVTHYYDPRVDIDRIRYRLTIKSTDTKLLRDLATALKREGFHPRLGVACRKGDKHQYRGHTIQAKRTLLDLSLQTNVHVIQLIERLPVRHQHKQLKKNLMLRLWRRGVKDWREINKEVWAVRSTIKQEIVQCVQEAKKDFEKRH